MVKSVLGVNHQGLRDWAIQRATAMIMAVYIILFFIYLLIHPNLSFAEWHSLFAQPWMKIATLLTLISILYHAWIGIWTVFTDYIKSFFLRAVLEFFVLLLLATLFIWGVLIVWSV